ncbi:hypothetical protein RRG08_035330 [Elysia crispata]|uniref:Uncharacterized protein n=1 Tax=Elysia crispata TaxID=231223 RepID=A0AAE0Y4A1_9GAST|nr:hypothetical protein RRG08_035330 [Elysia crispata]
MTSLNSGNNPLKRIPWVVKAVAYLTLVEKLLEMSEVVIKLVNVIIPCVCMCLQPQVSLVSLPDGELGCDTAISQGYRVPVTNDYRKKN